MGCTFARGMSPASDISLQIEGCWNGRQIISPEWVRESTTPKIRTLQWMDYGYLWWIHQNPELFVFEARGSGGHMLSIIPCLDLVVVVMGVGGGDMPDPDFVIHEYIIKAVTDRVMIPQAETFQPAAAS